MASSARTTSRPCTPRWVSSDSRSFIQFYWRDFIQWSCCPNAAVGRQKCWSRCLNIYTAILYQKTWSCFAQQSNIRRIRHNFLNVHAAVKRRKTGSYIPFLFAAVSFPKSRTNKLTYNIQILLFRNTNGICIVNKILQNNRIIITNIFLIFVLQAESHRTRRLARCWLSVRIPTNLTSPLSSHCSVNDYTVRQTAEQTD